LAVALAESCFGSNLGAVVELGEADQRPDVILFNETQSRIIISVRPSHALVVEAELLRRGIPFLGIGVVTGIGDLTVKVGASVYNWPVKSLHGIYESAIPKLMEG
jgi:phosphoribosylformylglycinamidine synthase